MVGGGEEQISEARLPERSRVLYRCNGQADEGAGILFRLILMKKKSLIQPGEVEHRPNRESWKFRITEGWHSFLYRPVAKWKRL